MAWARVILAGGLALTACNASDAPGESPSPATPTSTAPGDEPTGVIAFVKGSDPGHGDIYQGTPDGSMPELFTREVDRILPSWSPDATQIAFSRRGDVYVADADGPDETRLTHDSAFEGWPVWAPEGASIAIVRLEQGQREMIDVIDSTTGQKLHSIRGVGPSWSPDGSQLAFSRSMSGERCASGIWVASVSDWSERALTDDMDTFPRWSPDGTRIAFSRRGVGEPDCGGDLWIMGADGSEPMEIANAVGTGWSWLPDGSGVVTARDDDIDVLTLGSAGLSSETISPGLGELLSLDVAADGRFVVVVSLTEGPAQEACDPTCDTDLHVVSIEDGGVVRLTHDVIPDDLPAWSPS